MNELQDEIINKIDNLQEVKRIRKLVEKLNSNEEYLSLMKEFEENQIYYARNNILKEKIVELRKKLFDIDDLKEYLSLETNLRLFSNRISNIISDIVNDKNC